MSEAFLNVAKECFNRHMRGNEQTARKPSEYLLDEILGQLKVCKAHIEKISHPEMTVNVLPAVGWELSVKPSFPHGEEIRGAIQYWIDSGEVVGSMTVGGRKVSLTRNPTLSCVSAEAQILVSEVLKIHWNQAG